MNYRRFFVAVLGFFVGVSAMGLTPGPVSAVPALSALSVATGAPLPACTYDNVLTPHREYTDWKRTLLDTRYKLGRKYVPPRLVSVHEAGIAGIGKVRPLVIPDLRAMRLAARAAGSPIEVSSAYRGFERQEELFSYWVDRYGMVKATATSARPGHSEHQLGTTLDLKAKGGASPWSADDWGATPTGAWLRKNAWKFGFVMSYPKGKRSVTCYSYEPWHYRYFGREVARAIHFSGLTTRQWLWKHRFDG